MYCSRETCVLLKKCPDRFKWHLFGEGILYFRSFPLQSTDLKLTNIFKHQLNILFTLDGPKIPRESEVDRTVKIFVTPSPLCPLKICVRWRKRLLYAFIRFSFSKPFEWYMMTIYTYLFELFFPQKPQTTCILFY
jgi:hypothetical protein